MRGRIIDTRPGIAGINVTPIIDVALVLVIILLITAPVLSISDLGVNLPQAMTRGMEDENRLSITLSITGELSIDKMIVSRGDLPDELGRILAGRQDEGIIVVVRADEDVPYQMVEDVLKKAREAGADRLAIATTQGGKGIEWTPTL
ncbi:MAG: biopolymer transporter ExbD [Bacteroidales bacterium]|nr:biopolymer transporter ExbD [Candidatus Latescibacterota bacterium]